MRWMSVDVRKTYVAAVPLPVRRALRDGAVIAGLLFFAYLFVIVAPVAGTFGYDAFAYWSVNAADPYAVPVGGLGAFNYSPPIARLFGPFGSLEWLTFLWLWLALLIGNVVWLGRRGVRVVWLLAFPPVALELYHGNIHLWIAAAIALGFRYPWTWGFVLLTKVTPGIGLLWFAVRREWRALAIALGVTGAIVLVSVVLDAGLWREWIAFVTSTPGGWLGRPVPDRRPALAPTACGRRARRRGAPAPTVAGRWSWRRPSRCRCCGSAGSRSARRWPASHCGHGRTGPSCRPNRPEVGLTFRSMVPAMAGTLGPQPTGGATGHHRSTSRAGLWSSTVRHPATGRQPSIEAVP